MTTRNRTELTRDMVRLLHIAPYRLGLMERQFSATEIYRMHREEVVEPETTD